MELKKLRRRIDLLDRELIRLLNRRAGLSLDIARLKRQVGKSVYSPDREQDVLCKVASSNPGPLTNSALQAVYREIMSASLALGASLKIAYLGPEATFTHLAALKRFGSQVEYLPCESIADVFMQVEKGEADYGVVPIENSIEGAVTHTMDMLVDSDLKISAQIIQPISHNLLSRERSKAKIRRIYSIGQVFGQCRIWLQKNLPGVERLEVSSTTRAAQISAKERSSAAIASGLAARVYGLNVLAKGIEDFTHNITRFLVVGKSDVPATGKDRTSLVFSIKDKVGALHDMLMPFKRNRINLTKIESRPSKKKAWDYYFFVDLEGHQDLPRIKKAIRELEGKTKFLKVLGSYPIGE